MIISKEYEIYQVDQNWRTFLTHLDRAPVSALNPSRHWFDYHWTDHIEQDLEFVVIDSKKEAISPYFKRLLPTLGNSLGIEEPLRIAVFDIKGTPFNPEEDKEYFARVLVESLTGDIFRRKIVMHIGCEFRNGKYFGSKIRFTPFGFKTQDVHRLERKSDDHLLTVAIRATVIYVETISPLPPIIY